MDNLSLTDSPAILKRCSKCSVEKSVTEFTKSSSRKDGLHNWCKECAAANKATHYRKNREKVSVDRAAYYSANRKKVLTRAAAYRAKNREKLTANQIAYYIKHRVERAAYTASYQKAHPEKWRASTHRRRAKKRNAYGTHTAQQIKDLLEKQHGKCAYCKTNIRKKYHADHIIALANGGSNHVHNIQLLCPTCNLRKHTLDPIEFAQQNGLLL